MLGSSLTRILAIFILLLALPAEVVLLFNKVQEGKIATQEADIRFQTAINAAERQKAEAEQFEADAVTAQQTAKVAAALEAQKAALATQEALIQAQEAQNADMLKRAEAVEKEAQAKTAQAKAGYAQQQAKADAELSESQARAALSQLQLSEQNTICYRRSANFTQFYWCAVR